MVRRDDEDATLLVRPAIGGLQTKYRAPTVIETQSPDLLNVSFERRSIKRRQGCVPVNRFLPGKNALRNRGYSWTGMSAGVAPGPGTANLTYKRVDGHGLVPHRPYLNNYNVVTGGQTYTTFSVSFVVSPEPGGDDPNEGANWHLYNQMGGGGNENTANTYRYFPILSKGPVRGNSLRAGEGVPFSICCFRPTDAGHPSQNIVIWRAILYAGGAYTVLDSSGTASTRPRPHHVYRITFGVTSNSTGAGTRVATLKIAELRDDGGVTTETITSGVLAGPLAVNTQTIQLFDMPPQAVLADVAPFVTGTETAYRDSVLRFEGKIEDISYWSLDRTGDTTLTESLLPVDWEANPTGLLAYWRPHTLSELQTVPNATFEEDQTMIPEARGRDCPIMLCPHGPIWTRAFGHPALWFNGRTSYAFEKIGSTDNLNFAVTGATKGLFEYLVRDAVPACRPHAVSVRFVVDSIESTSGAEAAAQTLVAWYGVCHFGISNQGHLFLATFSGAGPFAAAVFGTTVLVPGLTYTVTYEREDSANAKLYLNGIQEIAVAGLTVPNNETVGTLVLGTEDQSGIGEFGTIRRSNETVHFLGRIEDVRIAGGSGTKDIAIGRDLYDSELYPDAVKLFILDDSVGPPAAAVSSDGSAYVPIGKTNHLLIPPITFIGLDTPDVELTAKRALLVTGNATDRVTLNLLYNPPALPDGVNNNPAMRAVFSQFFAWWNFDDDPSILTRRQESRYRGGVGRETTYATHRVWQQKYAVPDKTGLAFPLTLRCVSGDMWAGVASPTPVGLPWQISPMELRPRLAMGMIRGRPYENPITLIAPFKRDDGGRSTVVAAAGSLYEVKVPWTHDSPYRPLSDPARTCFYGTGRSGNHIEIGTPNTAWDLSAAGFKTIEFLVKVEAFDRVHEIALNWDGVAQNAYQWRVWIARDGSIGMDGYRAAGTLWRVATAHAANTAPTSPIRPGVWHHVALVIDVATIANDRIFVDGVNQPLDPLIGTHQDLWQGGGAFKWIAGHRFDLGAARTPAVEPDMLLPLRGFLRDFRISSTARYAADFTPPRTPLSADANTITLLPLNDGSDLLATSSGATIANGTIRCRELIPLSEGSILFSNSTPEHAYDWAVYQNVLYVTNGLGPPLAIRDKGTARGLVVSRMGVTPPNVEDMQASDGVAGGNVFLQTTAYIFAVTFVTEDGLESDPAFFSFTTGASGTGWAYILLNRLPRSLEPHVVARKIYAGIETPTLFTILSKTDDNLTDAVEISNFDGEAAEFTNGPPPSSTAIAIHRGRSYLTVANSAQLSFSEGIFVESHSNSGTAINRILLESPGGNVGTFVKEHQGYLYAGKRDSVFRITPGDDTPNFLVYRMGTTKGFASGASVVSFDAYLYGAMEKGVHVFDGSGLDYIGEDLEGLWRALTTGPGEIAGFFGAYYEPDNQYWMAIRRSTERFGRDIVVFDALVQDPATGRHPWTLFRTLPHSYLEVVEDPVTDAPMVWLGTPEGGLFQFHVGDVDGSRQKIHPATGVATALTGIATAGSATTLTISSGRFDPFGHRLAGLFCLVTHSATHSVTAARGVVEEFRILSNTDTILTFQAAQTYAVEVGDTFVIGAYWAYWSSCWHPLTSIEQMKLARYVGMDFAPNSGTTLELRVLEGSKGAGTGTALADAFDYAGVPTDLRYTLDQALGYQTDPIAMAIHAIYWRLFFGTRGINQPFEVFGFYVAFSEEGNIMGLP